MTVANVKRDDGLYWPVDVSAGFLVVKTYPVLYRQHCQEYGLTRDLYAVPRTDREPDESAIKYRGLDREALQSWKEGELEAESFLTQLESGKELRSADGFIFLLRDARETYSLLGDRQGEYEIIWSRVAGSEEAPPEGFQSLGFEATYFTGDHFSPSCDCMMFPRWHGTDDEGTLFLQYFRQLNSFGMFNTIEQARAFVECYLSLDWTEHDEYEFAEVFVRSVD